MIKKRILPLICAGVLLAVLPGVAAAFADPPAEGSPAPDFSLKSNEGKDISLKNYRGKWVVLYFYPKDFTQGCTIEAHNFQRDIDKYKQAHAVILGVSVDTTDSHQSFCTKEGLSFTLLSDPDGKVSEQYASVMDYQGKKLSARSTFIIDPKGNVAKVYMKVHPQEHSDEVLAALAALQKR